MTISDDAAGRQPTVYEGGGSDALSTTVHESGGATGRETLFEGGGAPARATAGATVHEPGAPVGHSAAPVGGTRSGRSYELPSPLAADYEFVGTLSTSGSQADVLRCRRRAGGDDVAMKLYRDAAVVDDEAIAELQKVRSTHVVRVLDFVRWHGEVWEVQEYLPEGTLREVLLRHPKGLPVAQVREILADLTTGLETVHGRGLVHRDLKPANLFVRSSSPWRLAIGDFGVARHQDASRVLGSVAGTMAYMAPEAALGATMRPGDWWSLGVIIAELLTGHHPLADPETKAVPGDLEMKWAAAKGHLTATGPDERWTLLCAGLLTVSEEDRWSGKEVRAWLVGASPRVHTATTESDNRVLTAFPFAGRSHQTTTELAAAFRVNTRAAEELVADERVRERLRLWLGERGLAGAADALLVTSPTPPLTVVQLQGIMDAASTPVLGGVTLDAVGLAKLARRASGGDHDAAILIRTLREHQILGELAAYRPEAEPLGVVDERLRGWWRRIDALPLLARTHLLGQADQTEGALLAAALDDAEHKKRRVANDKALRRVDTATPDFREMARGRLGSDTPEAFGVQTAFALALPASQREQQTADRRARATRSEARRRDASRNFRVGARRSLWLLIPLTLVALPMAAEVTYFGDYQTALVTLGPWFVGAVLVSGALHAFHPRAVRSATVIGLALMMLWWLQSAAPSFEVIGQDGPAPARMWTGVYVAIVVALVVGWLAGFLPQVEGPSSWAVEAAWVTLPLLWVTTASAIVHASIGDAVDRAVNEAPQWFVSAVVAVAGWVEPVSALQPTWAMPEGGFGVLLVGWALLLIVPRVGASPGVSVLIHAAVWLAAMFLVLGNILFLAAPLLLLGTLTLGLLIGGFVAVGVIMLIGSAGS